MKDIKDMTLEGRKGNIKRIEGEIKLEQINLLRIIKQMYTSFSDSNKKLALEIVKALS